MEGLVGLEKRAFWGAIASAATRILPRVLSAGKAAKNAIPKSVGNAAGEGAKTGIGGKILGGAKDLFFSKTGLGLGTAFAVPDIIAKATSNSDEIARNTVTAIGRTQAQSTPSMYGAASKQFSNMPH